MFESIKILKHHGRQYIPNPLEVNLPETYAGIPAIAANTPQSVWDACASICPTQAIERVKRYIDLGTCVFCRECERIAGTAYIRFTSNHKMATNNRNALHISAETAAPTVEPERVRNEIRRIYGRSLKLRQVSAGGDGSNEWELNALSNVQFDMGRYGIEFVASPKHADGIVITGPITKNMAEALRICYNAVPEPKIVILAGTDAISGGIFADSAALDRSFLQEMTIDLYVPGNPVHPLTFLHGIYMLLHSER